jgi:hypothetical protein
MAADINQPTNTENWLEEPKKIPSMLNVLTILTFIGSGLGAISAITGYFTAAGNYERQLQLQDKMADMPAIVKNMMGPDPVETARKQLENRFPIMLLTLVGALLCLYGALQMRKLKKAGFPIYIIGDLVPFLAIFIFIGMGMLSGFAMIFAVVITIVFIILYATQLKYLK